MGHGTHLILLPFTNIYSSSSERERERVSGQVRGKKKRKYEVLIIKGVFWGQKWWCNETWKWCENRCEMGCGHRFIVLALPFSSTNTSLNSLKNFWARPQHWYFRQYYLCPRPLRLPGYSFFLCQGCWLNIFYQRPKMPLLPSSHPKYPLSKHR